MLRRLSALFQYLDDPTGNATSAVQWKKNNTSADSFGRQCWRGNATTMAVVKGQDLAAVSLAELVGERDWSATPLGPIEKWPQSLRTAVNILITSPLCDVDGVGRQPHHAL